MAQPSLSQQILKLEDELGERLFDRLKRSAKPTAHGEAFLRRAVRILEEVDAAKREATDARDLLRGTVTVGVLPTIAPYLLPAVIVAFTEKFPGVEIVVQEDTTERLLPELATHALDVVITDAPAPANVRVEAFSHLLGEYETAFFAPASPIARVPTGIPAGI